MIKSISFFLLKTNHPTIGQIKSKIGGPLLQSVKQGNWETCCIQISYALNRSGGIIDSAYYYNSQMARRVRLAKSNDSFDYIFEVTDMKAYLDGRYGKAENYRGDKKYMISKIAGRKGIIAFGNRHVDVWDGSAIPHQSDYIDLFTMPSPKSIGIFFWEII